MANLSNRNPPSNTLTNNTTAERPLFKVGDSVLCPFLGYGAKPFILHEYEYHSELVAIHAHHSSIAFDSKGYFITAGDAQRGDIETNDNAPSLFIDTPANRQAIATLYQCKSDVKVIDITTPNDDEVVKVPSVLLSDISCEALSTSEVLDDLTNLLYIIINNEVSERQYKSMARLAYDATMHASQRQYDVVKTLNEPLNQSMFGGAEVGK